MNSTLLKTLLQQRVEQLSDQKLLELMIVSAGRLDSNILQLAARPRELGSLKGKVTVRFHEDFELTDEEFLRS